VASQARAVREIIEDPSASALVAVAQAGELPVTETLELEQRAGAQLRRGLDAIVVNAVLAARWSGEDLSRLDAVDGALPRAARRAAHAEAGRSRTQQGQLRRLRRSAKAHVLTLPFFAAPRVGPAQVDALARRLERELSAAS
jgi:hypothetical protein